jgi:hypothetical protein
MSDDGTYAKAIDDAARGVVTQEQPTTDQGTVAIKKSHLRWWLSKAELHRQVAKHTGNLEVCDRILTEWAMLLADADRPASRKAGNPGASE